MKFNVSDYSIVSTGIHRCSIATSAHNVGFDLLSLITDTIYLEMSEDFPVAGTTWFNINSAREGCQDRVFFYDISTRMPCRAWTMCKSYINHAIKSRQTISKFPSFWAPTHSFFQSDVWQRTLLGCKAFSGNKSPRSFKTAFAIKNASGLLTIVLCKDCAMCALCNVCINLIVWYIIVAKWVAWPNCNNIIINEFVINFEWDMLWLSQTVKVADPILYMIWIWIISLTSTSWSFHLSLSGWGNCNLGFCSTL